MKKLFYIILFLALNLKLCTLNSFAQDGSLDLTFGTAGKVTTHAADEDEAYDIAIQPDGKIIVVGNYKIIEDQDIFVIRYNADGTLDNSFNVDGKALLPLEQNQFAQSVIVLSDQKILVGGYQVVGTKTDLFMARYHRDGSLDLSFDEDGFMVVNLGSSKDYIYSLATQPDGKIIVAGSTSNGAGAKNDFLLMRYNIDGSIDTTFGIDGKSETDFDYSKDYGQAMILQPDGKILVAGYSAPFESDDDLAIARFDTDGNLDTTFGFNGKVTRDVSGFDDELLSVALQADGKILATGRTNSGSQLDFVLVRYNNDGSIDNTFNDSGLVVTTTGATVEIAYKVLVQPDQKIIIAGYRAGLASADFVLLRYNIDGSMDSTYGVDGLVLTDFGTTSDRAYTAIMQNDGKMIAAGYTYNGIEQDLAVVRYDLSFVSVKTHENLNELILYPNPVNERITLSLEKQITKASLKIGNATGQMVFAQNNLIGNNFTIDVSGFANGIYFLELNNGSTISRTKFIKN
jgi:uncharacterized delta-60 repeat protein